MATAPPYVALWRGSVAGVLDEPADAALPRMTAALPVLRRGGTELDPWQRVVQTPLTWLRPGSARRLRRQSDVGAR